MIDITSGCAGRELSWRDSVGPGDIVAFRFPVAAPAAAGRPQARPCLVLDVQTIGAWRYVEIAAGTSGTGAPDVGLVIDLHRGADYIVAGLQEPIRFLASRRLRVPLTHTGFVVDAATGSAVRGRLGDHALARMHAVRGRIRHLLQARVGRRRHPPGGLRARVAGRDFVVVTRRPRAVDRRKMAGADGREILRVAPLNRRPGTDGSGVA